MHVLVNKEPIIRDSNESFKTHIITLRSSHLEVFYKKSIPEKSVVCIKESIKGYFSKLMKSL